MSWIVGTAHAMGTAPAGGGEQNMLMQFMPFILIFAVFYFLLIRPQQKKAKEHREMLNAIKVGDPVITAGGLLGRVIEINGDLMVIDLGDTKVTAARAYLTAAPQLKQAAPAAAKKEKKSKKGSAEETQEASPAVEMAPETPAPEAPAKVEAVSKKDDDTKPVVQ